MTYSVKYSLKQINSLKILYRPEPGVTALQDEILDKTDKKKKNGDVDRKRRPALAVVLLTNIITQY